MSETMQIVYLVAVLILVLPTTLYLFRQNNALRNATIWLAILVGLAWGYHIVVELPQQATAPVTEDQSPPPEQSPVRNL